jgi:hypothetical protein
MRSAAARYTARLTLSFASAGLLALLAHAHMTRFIHRPLICMPIECFVAPIEHVPLLLVAAAVVAFQIPTRRRALRAIEDLCRGDP